MRCTVRAAEQHLEARSPARPPPRSRALQGPRAVGPAQSGPRVFEQPTRLTVCPLINAGSFETTVEPDAIVITQNIAICKAPVSQGSGYNACLIRPENVSIYKLFHTDLCGCMAANAASFSITPMGEVVSAPIGGADFADFLALADATVQAARPAVSKPSSFTFKTKCGSNTKTLTINAAGQLRLEEDNVGLFKMRNCFVASLADLDHVRYTTAGAVAGIFGGDNKISFSFLKEKLHLSIALAPDDLPRAHAAVLDVLAHGLPHAPLHVVPGLYGGSLEIGSDFFSVKCIKPSCHPSFATSNVVSARMRDVSIFHAALPSWQNALSIAMTEVELWALADAARQVFGMGNVLYVGSMITLGFAAMMAWLNFIVVFVSTEGTACAHALALTQPPCDRPRSFAEKPSSSSADRARGSRSPSSPSKTPRCCSSGSRRSLQTRSSSPRRGRAARRRGAAPRPPRPPRAPRLARPRATPGGRAPTRRTRGLRP